VRAHDVHERARDDRPRADRRGAAAEEERAAARARDEASEEGERDGERGARRARGALVRRVRPGVLGDVAEDALDDDAGFRDGEEEAVARRGRERRAGGARGDGGRAGRAGRRRAARESEERRDLLGRVVLRPLEDLGAWDVAAGELVDLHHRSLRHERDERRGREERERLEDAVLELLELVLGEAGVDDVDKGGRRRILAGERLLDRRELRDELGGEVHLADVLRLGGREGVAAEAEGARPHLRHEVDVAARERSGRGSGSGRRGGEGEEKGRRGRNGGHKRECSLRG
jgi:hypothetical protein